jgi:ubiquinone/menaquinone biosynthesis C-methylase UbiE
MTDESRWREAQKAQRKFWQSRNSRMHINEKFWNERISHGFDLNYDFFKNKDVLEVGCGATGIIFFLKNTKTRIGVEPMDVSDLIEDWKRPFVRKGVGEQLPFEDSSFDIAICFSVLEHILDPARLIGEVHRVLRHRGDFLLWFHCLRYQFKYLQPVLNKIDSVRPHHFTLCEILRLLLNNNNNNTNKSFEIIKQNIFRGLGLPLNQYFPTTQTRIRNLIGTCLMNDVWLWLRKM